MIELNNIRLRQGEHILFDCPQLRIADGWHVGVAGRNGCGKTSLFRLLLGERDADSGTLLRDDNQRLACMAQEVPGLTTSALEYVLEGDERLQAAQAALEAAEAADDGHAIGNCHAQLDTLDAWSAPARAAELLAGLGFSEAKQQAPVADFSGGWRVRMNLARTLMAQADILLLDEPTNHLDLDAILWLGDFLNRFPGTLLLISHDRHFLDQCVDHVLHIEHQQLTHYSGNYSSFERQRAEQLAQQQKAFDKQEKQRAHLQSFIDRFQYKATKARQAQSRIKALERMQLRAPAHVESGFTFDIPAPERLPDPLLALEDAVCGYDQPLLEQVNLRLTADSRIGLLGANGAGKSTLIKSLVGQLPLLGGKLTPAPDLVIGYFHQQQVDQLDLSASPLTLLQRHYTDITELDGRKYLGSFGFHGDRVFEPIDGFSGGEKTRLALALLVRQAPALLLLDEPTNHLDIEMREALMLALQDYRGAIVLISHDLTLLETCTDELLLVDQGKVTTWRDDMAAYARHLQQARQQAQQQQTIASTPAPDTPKQNKADKRKQAAQERARLKPLNNKIKKLEKQLDETQQQLEQINHQLADESLYQAENQAKLQPLLTDQGQLTQQQDALEEQLLEAMEALEAAR